MKKKILIVDDEELIPMVLQDVIGENSPHDVIICHNAPDAIRRLENEPFDLVITDFNIPVGCEGATIVCAARKLHSGIKVIVMSGGLTTDREKQIRDLCQADDYLLKPFHAGEALELIFRHLRDNEVPAAVS